MNYSKNEQPEQSKNLCSELALRVPQNFRKAFQFSSNQFGRGLSGTECDITRDASKKFGPSQVLRKKATHAICKLLHNAFCEKQIMAFYVVWKNSLLGHKANFELAVEGEKPQSQKPLKNKPKLEEKSHSAKKRRLPQRVRSKAQKKRRRRNLKTNTVRGKIKALSKNRQSAAKAKLAKKKPSKQVKSRLKARGLHTKKLHSRQSKSAAQQKSLHKWFRTMQTEPHSKFKKQKKKSAKLAKTFENNSKKFRKLSRRKVTFCRTGQEKILNLTLS